MANFIGDVPRTHALETFLCFQTLPKMCYERATE